MNLWDERDIDYPFTVSVSRPAASFGGDGACTETFGAVIASMTSDIQLSLKVRSLVASDSAGVSDNAVWILYCRPPAQIRANDRVCDGSRTFTVDAVCDWGSHTECVMREV
jgi:hypothetical protein